MPNKYYTHSARDKKDHQIPLLVIRVAIGYCPVKTLERDFAAESADIKFPTRSTPPPTQWWQAAQSMQAARSKKNAQNLQPSRRSRAATFKVPAELVSTAAAAIFNLLPARSELAPGLLSQYRRVLPPAPQTVRQGPLATTPSTRSDSMLRPSAPAQHRPGPDRNAPAAFRCQKTRVRRSCST